MYKPIKDFNLYEIDENGNVKNKKRNHIIKSQVNHQGYLQVLLTKNGKRFCRRVNRLVYESFIGEIPEGFQVNHINEDKLDNRVDNLNLVTAKENCNWGTRNNRIGSKNSKPILQINSLGIIIREWPSIMEAKRNGYNAGLISMCCKGKRNIHAGYTWKYKFNE